MASLFAEIYSGTRRYMFGKFRNFRNVHILIYEFIGLKILAEFILETNYPSETNYPLSVE